MKCAIGTCSNEGNPLRKLGQGGGTYRTVCNACYVERLRAAGCTDDELLAALRDGDDMRALARMKELNGRTPS